MDEQEPDSIYAVDLPKVKAVCLILSHRAAGGVFAGYLRAPFAVVGLAVLAFAWWYAVCKTPQVKQVGQEEQGITLSVPKLVLLFALMLLWGYLGGQTGFLPELGLGLPQRHLPGSDHKQLAGVLPAKGYGAGVLYRALAGPGGAGQTGIRPVWAGCRLDVRPYGPLGVDGAGHLSGGAEFVGLPACRYRQKGDRPAVLIFFSGMDILGALYSSRLPDLLAYDAMHLEWWTNDFQFSSPDDLPVLGVQPDSGGMAGNHLLLQEKDCRNYLLLGNGLPDVRPLPICGAGYFYGGARHCSAGTASKGVLQSAFSPANVLVLVVVLSITASYFWPITPLATAFWAKLSPGTRQRSRLLAKTF